jgi:hypothetical protein
MAKSARLSEHDIAIAALNKMQSSPKDAMVQLESCKTLSELANHGKLGEANATAGVKAICKAMKAFPTNVLLQFEGIAYLVRAFTINFSIVDTAAEEGCLHIVLNALKRYPTVLKIQVLGCTVISQYAYPGGPEDLIQKFQFEEIIGVVLDAMSLLLKESSQAELDDRSEPGQAFRFACFTIIQRLYLANAQGPTGKPGDDRLRVILRTASTILKSSDEVCIAFIAISAVTYRNSFNARLLGKPCVKLLLDGIQAHENDIEIQINGLQALDSMVHDEDNLSHALEHGGMHKVMHIMRKHSTNEKVQEKASEFFYHIFFPDGPDRGTKATFFEIGGVKHMAWCMNTYKNNRTVQMLGCEIFERLIYDFPNGKNRFEIMAKEGVHRALMAALCAHKDDPRVVLCACGTLTAIMASQGHISASEPEMQELGLQAIAHVLKSIPKHMDNAQVQYHAVNLLTFCIAKTALQTNLEMSTQTISTLYTVLNKHITIVGVVTAVCCALAVSVCASVQNQNFCGQIGMVDTLLKVIDLHKDNATLLQRARGLLDSITDGHDENSGYVMSAMTRQQIKRLHRAGAAEGTTSVNDSDSERLTQTDIVSKIVAVHEQEKLAETCSECGRSAGELGIVRMMRCSAVKGVNWV